MCACVLAITFKLSHHTTTTTVLWPFFRDHPGEPVPEENFWTLWCKARLTEADTETIRLGATPSWLTSAYLHLPPFFYRPDALPATQPTVSKHGMQSKHWSLTFKLNDLKSRSLACWFIFTLCKSKLQVKVHSHWMKNVMGWSTFGRLSSSLC